MQAPGAACRGSAAAQGCARAAAKRGPVTAALGATLHLRVRVCVCARAPGCVCVCVCMRVGATAEPLCAVVLGCELHNKPGCVRDAELSVSSFPRACKPH